MTRLNLYLCVEPPGEDAPAAAAEAAADGEAPAAGTTTATAVIAAALPAAEGPPLSSHAVSQPGLAVAAAATATAAGGLLSRSASAWRRDSLASLTSSRRPARSRHGSDATISALAGASRAEQARYLARARRLDGMDAIICWAEQADAAGRATPPSQPSLPSPYRAAISRQSSTASFASASFYAAAAAGYTAAAAGLAGGGG
ncbi:unnamed protein product, partial [Phaeothamnion confervicola]